MIIVANLCTMCSVINATYTCIQGVIYIQCVMYTMCDVYNTMCDVQHVTWAPTMPLPPKRVSVYMCMLPPLPLEQPPALPTLYCIMYISVTLCTYCIMYISVTLST